MEEINKTTPQVNFRAESSVYKQTKSILDSNKISVLNILYSTPRKITTSSIDPAEFISSDTVTDNIELNY